MYAEKWFSMPLWKLRIHAQLSQMKILGREIWRRAVEGEGWLELGARILRYVFLTLFAVVSWRFCIISSVYAWFRLADNLLDGDVRLQPGESLESYASERSQTLKFFLSFDFSGARARQEDILLAYFVRETQGLSVFTKLCDQVKRLWSLMQSDALRRKTMPLVSRLELEEFDFEQDATILRFCVMVLGGNEEQLQVIVEALCGLFSKTDCFLDCFDDVQKGIIHIPKEVLEHHDISLKMLRDCREEKELFALPGIQEWRREEGRRIQQQWLAAMRVVGGNFCSVFSNTALTKTVQLVIYMRFNRSVLNLSV